MAVAFDIATFKSGAGVETVTTDAFTVADVPNRVAILCMAHGTNNASSGFSASLGGTAGTLISGTDSEGAQTCRSLIFVVVNPPVGSQTATMSWTGNQSCTMGVVVCNGVDQSTPLDGATFTSSDTGSPSLQITSTSTGLTVDNAAVTTGVLSLNTQTLCWNDTAARQGAGSRGPGTGTTTHAWTNSTAAWAQSGVNFRAAGGGRAWILGRP